MNGFYVNAPCAAVRVVRAAQTYARAIGNRPYGNMVRYGGEKGVAKGE